jgi:hypothetical protein
MHVQPVSGIVPVLWNEPNIVRNLGKNTEYGTLDNQAAQLLHALCTADCTLQLYCQAKKCDGHQNNSRQRSEMDPDLTLSVIIYGQLSLSNTIGEWLSSYGMFLQDPVHCDRNVVYHNPHLLCKADEESAMTFSLVAPIPNVEVEQMNPRPDLFELLNEKHHLPETEAPMAISTALYRLASNLTVG